jgi:uncharacterized protein (TIGR03118 family)
MAIAPSNFGAFSGDLLVGNFGDGTIHAYNLAGTPQGALLDVNNNPVTIEGLWALQFGNGANAGPTNSLYFTAGISGGGNIEDHGLFGTITDAPEPGALWMMALGVGGLMVMKWRKRRRL